jgi:hypothetical protein
MHYTTIIPFAPDGSIVRGPYPAKVDFNNQPIPPEPPPPKIPPSQQQHSQQQAPHDQHPPPTKEYGDPWTWDDEEQDYVRIGKGRSTVSPMEVTSTYLMLTCHRRREAVVYRVSQGCVYQRIEDRGFFRCRGEPAQDRSQRFQGGIGIYRSGLFMGGASRRW